MRDTDVRQNPAPTRSESSSHGEGIDDSHRTLEAGFLALACQPKMEIDKVLRGWVGVLD